MDYKYIEQLLERYWQCDTTLEEEEILRAFFCQQDVPAELRRYRSLFTYGQEERADAPLGEDFDERMMAIVDAQTPVTAVEISIFSRMWPLLRSAAVVAAIVTFGVLMQLPFTREYASDDLEYTAADAVKTDFEVAYDEICDTFGLTASDTSSISRDFSQLR